MTPGMPASTSASCRTPGEPAPTTLTTATALTASWTPSSYPIRVGLRKPDPSIYKLTAAKIGIPPEACVFVDDTKANLPAASKLGMKSVHFTDAQSGVAEIRHLLDLAGGVRNPV